MPELETLRENDAALHEMYSADTEDTELSSEDEQAYRELIEQQRSSYLETAFQEKAEDGTVTTEVAPSIGDAALHDTIKMTGAQEVHAQYVSAAEDWRQPK